MRVLCALVSASLVAAFLTELRDQLLVRDFQDFLSDNIYAAQSLNNSLVRVLTHCPISEVVSFNERWVALQGILLSEIWGLGTPITAAWLISMAWLFGESLAKLSTLRTRKCWQPLLIAQPP